MSELGGVVVCTTVFIYTYFHCVSHPIPHVLTADNAAGNIIITSKKGTVLLPSLSPIFMTKHVCISEGFMHTKKNTSITIIIIMPQL